VVPGCGAGKSGLERHHVSTAERALAHSLCGAAGTDRAPGFSMRQIILYPSGAALLNNTQTVVKPLLAIRYMVSHNHTPLLGWALLGHCWWKMICEEA
jgi:hypothetical protein